LELTAEIPNMCDDWAQYAANLPDVFSPADLEFFQENGYVVLHNAVPPENLQAAVKAIWDFLEMDPENGEDWYRPPATPIGFVELYHHQAFWDNRTHPRIYKAFCQLWNDHKVRKSIWEFEDSCKFLHILCYVKFGIVLAQ